jgi:hypothetical protein
MESEDLAVEKLVASEIPGVGGSGWASLPPVGEGAYMAVVDECVAPESDESGIVRAA